MQNSAFAATRLRVGIVGAGRVGAVLGSAIAAAGHDVWAITATDPLQQERVEVLLPRAQIAPLDEVVKNSQAVLFAIPADQLPQLITGLQQAQLFSPGQLLMHTAAAHGYSVFAPAYGAGIIPLALHPLLQFTGTSVDLARLKESAIAVTAPPAAAAIGQTLALEIGAEPFLVADADRPGYATAVQAVRAQTAKLVRETIENFTVLGIPEPAALASSFLTASLAENLRTTEQP